MAQASSATTQPNQGESSHWGQIGILPSLSSILNWRNWRDKTPTNNKNRKTTKNNRNNKKRKTPSIDVNPWSLADGSHSQLIPSQTLNSTLRPPPEPPPTPRPPPEPPPESPPTARPPPKPPPLQNDSLHTQDALTDLPDLIPQREVEQDAASSTPLWKTRQKRYGPEWDLEPPEQHIRVVLANLQRLPTIANADRSTQLLTQMALRVPDVTLFNDVGLAWKVLPTEDQWAERARKAHLPRHKARFSVNTHEITDELVQWGGIGIVLMREAQPRLYQKMGSDPTNLGRWTWARIQGRNGHFLRVVSA